MRFLLALIFLIPFTLSGQSYQVGVQLNSIYQSSSSYTFNRVNNGEFCYDPEVRFIHAEVFGMKEWNGNYARLALSLYKFNETDNNLFEYEIGNSADISASSSGASNGLFLEYGKVLPLPKKFTFRAGIYSFLFRSHGSKQTYFVDYYDVNGDFDGTLRLYGYYTSEHATGLGFSLRLGYELWNRVELGLAVMPGFEYKFFQSTARNMTVLTDRNGVETGRFTETDPYKSKALQSTSTLLPRFSLAIRLGKQPPSE